jgi:hypothetical protein
MSAKERQAEIEKLVAQSTRSAAEAQVFRDAWLKAAEAEQQQRSKDAAAARSQAMAAAGAARKAAIQDAEIAAAAALAAAESQREAALAAIETLLRFTFIDPVGLGQNVAAFMKLADYDENLVTSKAWSEPHHIEQQLAALSEHMENVIQKYLRAQFKSIEEYNAQAGEVAEPYRVLMVFDFPANFTEASARRLVSIAQNGPRCGVYTIVLVDTSKPLPYGFTLADLEQGATVIAWDGQAWRWRDADFKDHPLTLDAPPPLELMDRIVETVGKQARKSSEVKVPFTRIAPRARSGGAAIGWMAALSTPPRACASSWGRWAPARCRNWCWAARARRSTRSLSGAPAPANRRCCTRSSPTWRSPTARTRCSFT